MGVPVSRPVHRAHTHAPYPLQAPIRSPYGLRKWGREGPVSEIGYGLALGAPGREMVAPISGR
eukprot:1818364-Alexandrium_andersonii.AAC.1